MEKLQEFEILNSKIDIEDIEIDYKGLRGTKTEGGTVNVNGFDHEYSSDLKRRKSIRYYDKK